MITTMAISRDVPLVDSVQPVKEGSVLSYQMPTKAVPRNLPTLRCPITSTALQAWALYLFFSLYTLQQHHHMTSLKTPLETAHKIEQATKEQSSCAEWHQLWWSRITSTKFPEVCHIRAHSSAENIPGSAPGVSKSSLSQALHIKSCSTM